MNARDLVFSISVTFRRLCAALLRLGKYLSPELNEIVIAL